MARSMAARKVRPMRLRTRLSTLHVLVVGGAIAAAALDARAAPGGDSPPGAAPAGAGSREAPAAPAALDRSGRKRVGVASVYANKFAGRKMANGAPMDPHEDNAASKTLP